MTPQVESCRFRAGDALPAVLVLRDLAELLGLGTSRTWELYQQGEFARFELLPRIGNRPRFSGKKLQAWLDPEDHATTETEPRYFKAGHRARALRGVK
jgi:predicted DNA-binding transcriptional regulator AlpA